LRKWQARRIRRLSSRRGQGRSAAQIDKTNSEAMLNQAKATQAGQPANTNDPNMEAAMQWRETIFNGLIKLEVAKIGAKSQNDSDALDAQIEGLLHLSGLAIRSGHADAPDGP
jgi:hypothetical protein